MATIKSLTNKRTAMIADIDSLKAKVDGHAAAPLDEDEVILYLEKVSLYRNKNTTIYDDIVSQCKDNHQIATHQAPYNAEDERLDAIEIRLKVIKKSIPVPTVSTAATSKPMEVRLPKLDLPTFSGKLQDWMSFRDLFRAAVHHQTQASDAQKLQYLKAACQGEAALLIQSLQITNANYAEAWKILEERYEDPRELIRCNLERLLSQPVLTQETPAALQKIVDTTRECVRFFETLKINKEQLCDLLIIHLISRKLDQESRVQWERTLHRGVIPTLKQFYELLDHHARVTAAAKPINSKVPCKQNQSPFVKNAEKKPVTAVHQAETTEKKSTKCGFCCENHHIFQCKSFQALSVKERKKTASSKQWCFNCLTSTTHQAQDCPRQKCKFCNNAHNRLLHEDTSPPQQKENPDPIQQQPPPPKKDDGVTVYLSSNQRNIAQVLLSTAVILVKDNSGRFEPCRVLLDSGAKASFVTSKFATRLGLRRQKVSVPLEGIAGVKAGQANQMSKIIFKSRHDENNIMETEALILQKITREQLSLPVTEVSWPHLQGINLADPNYYKPGDIDVLLGMNIFYELMLGGIRKGPKGAPIALESSLGWIIGGELATTAKPTPISINHCELDTTLKRFWEVEELPQKTILTPEEKQCEEHFASTHTRDKSGRFVVRLPFKSSIKTIGESRNIAIKRLKQMERRFARDPELHRQYSEIINEYLELGHMEVVPASEVNTDRTTYYMPHHVVVKLSSTTTKYRVVCDASAASTTGTSLNSILMVGPKQQDDLIVHLIRFRKWLIAFTADIAKMYRQVKVHEEDVDFLRIVWRDSTHKPIQDYRFVTVTFGTAAAPYLAVKCVQQLALDEETKYPKASAVIRRDFYVDDCMSGADSEKVGLKLQQDLIELLSHGGFELRKWSSNSPALLAALPQNMRETNLPLCLDKDETIKTLGLEWHPAADHFAFKIQVPDVTKTPTKRLVASEIAKVFDPLGMLSPVTINAKIIIQSLWKEDLGWDDPLPPEFQEDWIIYRNQLTAIESIKIPRQVKLSNAIQLQLHGFCDASERAYAAVVFLRSMDGNGQVLVRMVAAKTRIAPVKQITLPRLELCGAVLLVRLIQCIKKALDVQLDGIFGWTDSTIVLAWLASSPQRWKTFVANRVSEIQDEIPSSNWNHVKSDENPADCATRGILPSDLQNHPLWWTGPDWLSSIQIPQDLSAVNDTTEEQRTTIQVHQINTKNSLLSKYNNLQKLLRITAICRRFLKPTSSVGGSRNTLAVSTAELDEALLTWIKVVQAEEFKDEIQILKKNKELKNKSKIKSLAPFLDDKGIIRVGGRLKKAAIHFDAKHQFLLPKRHMLTHLIIRQEHERNLHAGPQLLLSALRQRFWILSGRDAVRQFVSQCIKCFRFQAQNPNQNMGELPTARVTPNPPFQRCGVDYAGPYLLTLRKGRGQRSIKMYVALFVCMVTRAIHLELVSDMTTEAFIAALHRFISRRGRPTDIYSDCGSNFVGASNELKEVQRLVTSTNLQNQVNQACANDAITWHFNPPATPHFGGLWEAGVKSMKFHLRRVIGRSILTTEEMQTLLAQVEACLNSRPMTDISTNANDLEPLTPGHFLIGRPLTALPDKDITHINEGRLSRWQRVQQMFQHFWRRWSNEFISRLQQRNKWTSTTENLRIGDIVIIMEDNVPPIKWKLGRVTKASPGDDGKVRVVTLKTATGDMTRSVVKLCVLP